MKRLGARKPELPDLPPSTTGMGVSTVTAARILKGQLHHNPGEETRLEMDKFPYVALSKVSSSPEPPTFQEKVKGYNSPRICIIISKRG